MNVSLASQDAAASSGLGLHSFSGQWSSTENFYISMASDEEDSFMLRTDHFSAISMQARVPSNLIDPCVETVLCSDFQLLPVDDTAAILTFVMCTGNSCFYEYAPCTYEVGSGNTSYASCDMLHDDDDDTPS